MLEGPSWTFRCLSVVLEKSKLDELSASDTLLLGLVTEDVDTTLIPPGTQYGTTCSKAEQRKPPKYAGFAIFCKPLQCLMDHS